MLKSGPCNLQKPIPTEKQMDPVFDLFGELPVGWNCRASDSGEGAFLSVTTEDAACYFERCLGQVEGLKRFTSGYRTNPFWMKPAVGELISELNSETQWLLCELEGGRYLSLIPLLDFETSTRFSLKGSQEGLVVAGETGDPWVLSRGGVALYARIGYDPMALLSESAAEVSKWIDKGRLRRDKSVPEFVDLFGWCTWDAFYKDVSAEKVLEGLSSFRAGGVEPRLIILDDGWQSTRRSPIGEHRLFSLSPNEKFAGDLSELIAIAKQKFCIETFIVWHALLGYWGGLEDLGFSAYDPRSVARSFGPGILDRDTKWNIGPWGAIVGVPEVGKVETFYRDYHNLLSKQGVDGVKVDAQAMLEAVSSGQGGRVRVAQTFREALESSVGAHFDDRLINCMSCTMEATYLAKDSIVMRTSDDFYPLKPETHGAHLFINAHVSMWLGEFMLPDWDMFQSSHPMAKMHAAARAISGGPVYVSDKPGQQDFELLSKLVLSNGRILRADGPARLTKDNLFSDPRTDPVLLKVFNRNRDCGVLGIFNIRYHQEPEERTRLKGDYGVSDIEGLDGERFLAYEHRSEKLTTCQLDERFEIELEEGDWELVTFAPIEKGFAVVGLADKLNSSGAVLGRVWMTERECRIRIADGGLLRCWSKRSPSEVRVKGEDCSFVYVPENGRLDVEIEGGGALDLAFRWNA